MARKFSSVAGEMILQTGINATSGGITLDTISGLPSQFPFTLILDLGQLSEEVVEATASGGGTSLLITRGVDGTSASPHSAGAKVVHGPSARDFNEPLTHIERTSSVHGVTGSVVGTSDTQTLDRKTFTSSATNATALIVRSTAGQTAPLQSWANSSGTPLTTVEASGKVNAATVDAKDSVFSASSGSAVALTAKGSSTQTANVFSVKNSSSSDLFSVGATGTTTAKTLVSGDSTVTASAATAVPLVVKGVGSQTGDLTQWTDYSSGVLAKVTSAGRVNAVGVDVGASTIAAAAAGDVPLTLSGAASQSSDYVQVRNSSSSVLVSIDKDGKLTASGVSTNGALAAGTAAISTSLAAPTITATTVTATTVKGDNLPGRVLKGTLAVGAFSPGEIAYTGYIGFGAALTDPIVVACSGDDSIPGLVVSVVNVSSTQFRLKIKNYGDGVVTGARVNWIAAGS